VVLDTRDWAAGENFVLKMNDALERADRVVALFSNAYFEPQRYTTIEWTTILAAGGHLVPLRIEDVSPPPVLRALIYRDLYGLREEQARRVLLEAVSGPRRMDRPPKFPGRHAPDGSARAQRLGPRLPGALPAVWNAPIRSPAFTGRDGMMVRLREQLSSGGTAVVQALHGMGGVGKTQLAVEYVHRFAADYDLVWWVDAEKASLIGEQLAALGVAAGWVAPEGEISTSVATVKAQLRGRAGWLLVFDNAERPADLAPWLAEGPGHALITSRNPGWGQLAVPMEVDVFTRPESVALLRAQVPTLSEVGAAQLAAALGDLPLALAQAAGVLAETGVPADEYLHILRSRAAELLSEGAPISYPVSLAAAIRLAADRLADEDAAAAQLLELCAFLAPEPVPVALFTAAPAGALPQPLAAVAGSPLALRRSLGRVVRYGLARVAPDGPQLHRLIQAVIRDHLDSARKQAVQTQLEALLVGFHLGDPMDPASWSDWARLLPHVLALDPVSSGNIHLRDVACKATRYLLARGDTHAGLDLARDLHARWRESLGPNDEHTRWAADSLARAYRGLGRYTEARRLNEESLDRDREVHGYDHPSTLATAISLAVDLRALGEVEQARQLAEDTLIRSRRVLGEDHPDTLTSANSLAANLRASGAVEQARQLNEDTLTRRRRILGEDHPDTLTSANSLTVDLTALGLVEQARQLAEDTLTRRRRILGEDHPDTLKSTQNLAEILSDLRSLRKQDR
jgi:tetratricopeptide (TPR) repeat protein